MRMGPFINMIATAYGLPETTVALVARAMREAGWLTTGARGVNAPDMVPEDAARLTLALLSGEPPGKVVEEFEFLRTLQAKEAYPDKGFTVGCALAANHNLENALVWLFGLTKASQVIKGHGLAVWEKLYWPSVNVSLDASSRAARIDVPGHYTAYEDLAGVEELEKLSTLPYSLDTTARMMDLWGRSGTWESGTVTYGRGMRVIRTITNKEIEIVTEALARSENAVGSEG